MTIDWRDTLNTLLPQFEAAAARSCGLHHLFVEVSDDEREKMAGPNWFQRSYDDVQVEDGKIRYGKWGCSTSGTLPGISPGFREPRRDESFKDESPLLIRDCSGKVWAIATPMKLRHGYLCGPGSELASQFESLANATAVALASAKELEKHPFAADLTDIFRKPRGGIRYVYGEVFDPPKEFVAQGWRAGIRQYPRGVLIDMPISERTPDSKAWLLLLHRLGWRGIEGSGLRASRSVWEGNSEFKLGFLDHDWSNHPPEFAQRFQHISKESFYSVLGTTDAPIDVFLASVFAIQLLLADLGIATTAASDDKEVDYSEEPWNLLEMPRLQEKTYKEPQSVTLKIGILVATKVEREAVLKKLKPLQDELSVVKVFAGNNTYYLGRLGVTDIVLCMTAMGSVGRDSSVIVTSEMIRDWHLSAVIMVGIAFGKDAAKQQIGNVLVSDRVICYEPERIGINSTEDRGHQPLAGLVLLNRFRNVEEWSFRSPSAGDCGFQVGPVLSGEKLVDDPEFKQQLFEKYPTAIGGEMEGAGLAAAAERSRCEWIVVKGICDWGDGSKTKHHQAFAAASAVDLVEHVLNQLGALDAIG